MKPHIILAVIATLIAVYLAGCATSDARRAGRLTTAGAVLAFESPSDQAVMIQAKNKIDAFLASGGVITDIVVREFVDWLTESLGRNPAAVRLVVMELQGMVNEDIEAFGPTQLEPAREFVRGVSDVLAIAYPDGL